MHRHHHVLPGRIRIEPGQKKEACWLTQVAAVRLSLSCLLLVLCTGYTKLSRQRRNRDLLKLPVWSTWHQICAGTAVMIPGVLRAPHLLCGWRCHELLFPLSGWDVGQKTKTSVITRYINTLNCFESKWWLVRTARLPSDCKLQLYKRQYTEMWWSLIGYKLSPGACSIIPLISNTGVTVGSGLT